MKNKLLLSVMMLALGVQSHTLVASESYIQLISKKDGTAFDVPQNVACVSETIKSVVQPTGELAFWEGTSNIVKLPLGGAELGAIVQMMTRYAEQQKQEKELFAAVRNGIEPWQLDLIDQSIIKQAIEYAKSQQLSVEKINELAATIPNNVRLGDLLEEAYFLNVPDIIKRAIAYAYQAKSGY